MNSNHKRTAINPAHHRASLNNFEADFLCTLPDIIPVGYIQQWVLHNWPLDYPDVSEIEGKYLTLPQES